MKLPSLPPALPGPSTRPGDLVTGAVVVALTALLTLVLTRDVSDVPVMVSPVLVALGLQR